ncbi:MAG: hypothetical protein JNL39_15660 [Opitutaceae bacterium]|nr:hypothetical protein [Opitutaceae bacterium]
MKTPPRLLILAVVVVTLAGAGILLQRLAAPAWQELRGRQPALRLDASLATAGQGATIGLLGGFRALAADATWIRVYALWERRDLAGVQNLIQLVATLDPRPIYFWLNGARIMGHDFAAWRVDAAGGYEAVAEPERLRLDREQGQLALRHLDAAAAFHPASAELWIERASLELNRLHDPLAAAESYRRAWEQPNAPYFTARLHAELLRRAGKKREALDWLMKLHPTLPADDEAAAAPVVLTRIRELEKELGVPPALAYRVRR